MKRGRPTKAPLKTPFPKNPPTHQLHVTAKLMADFDKYSNGSMMMTITDCPISQDGKQIGSVGFEVCGRAVLLAIGNERYEVSSLDLFTALMEAKNAVVQV